MKIVLSNKKEVVKLLNDLYKLKNTENEIKEVEIEECSTNFITKEFKTREADILYKIKNRNIFFLIEHQSKIDYSMSYRIFEYSKEIIDRAINKEIIKNRNYKMPVVYPIVIYHIFLHIFLPNLAKEELEDLKEIIKKLEGRKEKKEMLAVEEMLRKSYKKEYRKGRIEGREEGRLEGQLLEKKQIVLELLRRKVDKNFIMEVAGVTEEELRKIKDTYGEE